MTPEEAQREEVSLQEQLDQMTRNYAELEAKRQRARDRLDEYNRKYPDFRRELNDLYSKTWEDQVNELGTIDPATGRVKVIAGSELKRKAIADLRMKYFGTTEQVGDVASSDLRRAERRHGYFGRRHCGNKKEIATTSPRIKTGSPCRQPSHCSSARKVAADS